jgi:hypothetical protein
MTTSAFPLHGEHGPLRALARLPGIDRIPPPARPWVFAVEDTAIQITWRALGPGPVRFRVADTAVEVLTDGGPGAVELTGLPPATRLTVQLDGAGLDGPRPVPHRWRRIRATTLPAPPGAEVFRFATISDLHVGLEAFGFRETMVEDPRPAEATPALHAPPGPRRYGTRAVPRRHHPRAAAGQPRPVRRRPTPPLRRSAPRSRPHRHIE